MISSKGRRRLNLERRSACGAGLGCRRGTWEKSIMTSRMGEAEVALPDDIYDSKFPKEVRWVPKNTLIKYPM